jgi:hypothetical protein
MAAKKTDTTKKGGTKGAATAKRGAAKGSVKAETGAKANTPKAAGAAKTAGRKGTKKAAGIKLTDRQAEFLKKVKGASEPGYRVGKGEQRTIDALVERKLLKRGPKDKESGTYHYMISKTGEKHLSTIGTAGAESK